MEMNGKPETSPGPAFYKRDRDFLNSLDEIISRNYANHATDLHVLSVQLGISSRQLQRKSKALLGFSPSEYLRNYRLQKSLGLLKRGIPVREVARDVGFTSQSYFASCFKARFGNTPTEYQRYQSGSGSTVRSH
jgi:AraC-like DNA-binding protein